MYSWGANVAANIDTEDVYVEDLVEQTSTDGTTLAYTIRSSSADITVQSFIVRSSIIRVKVPHSNSTMEETDRYEHIPFDAEDSVHGPVVTVNVCHEHSPLRFIVFILYTVYRRRIMMMR